MLVFIVLQRVRIADGVTLAACVVGKRLGVLAQLARHALTLVGRPRATGGAARAGLAALARGAAWVRLAALAGLTGLV